MFHSAEHRLCLFFFSMNCSPSFSLPKTITPPHFLHFCLLMGMISVMRNVRFSPFTLKGRAHQGLSGLSSCPSCSATSQHFKNKLWWGLFPVLQSYITVKLQDVSNRNSGGVASYICCKVFLGGQMGKAESPLLFDSQTCWHPQLFRVSLSAFYSWDVCVSLHDSAMSRLSMCHISLGGYQKDISMLKRVCVEENLKGVGKKNWSIKHLQ